MQRFFTRPIIPAILTWGVICLVLFYGVDLFLMPSLAGKFRKTSEVPKLLGMRMEKAEEILHPEGLGLMLDSSSDFSDVPAGRIMSQFPNPGTEVKQGRRIWVRISKGRRAVEVPVLRGMSLRQAEISLQQIGLRLGNTDYMTSSDAPAGAVIGSYPSAKTMMARDRPVNVEVSTGTEKQLTHMPSFIGLSLSQARNQIEALHLSLGKISQQPDAKNLPETILAQSPSAGALLKGEPVDLVVSQ